MNAESGLGKHGTVEYRLQIEKVTLFSGNFSKKYTEKGKNLFTLDCE